MFRFQVPERAVQRISSCAGREQLREFITIQGSDARDRADLRQNRIDSLIVARDRNGLAASSILFIIDMDDYDTRFCAAAARNAERVLQRKDLLPDFDFQTDE